MQRSKEELQHQNTKKGNTYLSGYLAVMMDFWIMDPRGLWHDLNSMMFLSRQKVQLQAPCKVRIEDIQSSDTSRIGTPAQCGFEDCHF